MLRYYKPARDKDIHQRGYFSYITESVIHIHNVLLNYPNEQLKVYYDFSNIPGYGVKNIFDICFIQDRDDYLTKIDEYSNIELVNYITPLNAYDSSSFTPKNLQMCEKIINDNLVLKNKMKDLFMLRHSQINFANTIGFHRRATDMNDVHNFPTIDLSIIFNILEKENFENLFLMSDNLNDLKEFKKRYGNKLITYDEFSSSDSTTIPFFKLKNSDKNIKKHIQEIVFGAYTLGMTKKLFCTKSNLAAFSIFSNSKLNYTILT